MAYFFYLLQNVRFGTTYLNCSVIPDYIKTFLNYITANAQVKKSFE